MTKYTKTIVKAVRQLTQVPVGHRARHISDTAAYAERATALGQRIF